MPHKHRWTIAHWCGTKVGYRCKCGANFEREMDAEERARARMRFMPPKKEDVHSVWHRMPLPAEWNSCRDADEKMKIVGKIEKFAKKHPDQVIPLHCDDSYHANSDLILVTHEAERQWMGVTALVFTQCDGQAPAQFFFYPSDVDDLIKQLKIIQARSRRKAKLEAADAKKRTEWWNSRMLVHPAPEKIEEE